MVPAAARQKNSRRFAAALFMPALSLLLRFAVTMRLETAERLINVLAE
jgi:hypothetical protein